MKSYINQRVAECIDQIIDTGLVKSKRKIAEILSESPSKLTEIAKGTRNADAELIFNLWKHFKVNPMWIITKQGKAFLNNEMFDDTNEVEQNTPYFDIHEAYNDLKKLNHFYEEKIAVLEQNIEVLK